MSMIITHSQKWVGFLLGGLSFVKRAERVCDAVRFAKPTRVARPVLHAHADTYTHIDTYTLTHFSLSLFSAAKSAGATPVSAAVGCKAGTRATPTAQVGHSV